MSPSNIESESPAALAQASLILGSYARVVGRSLLPDPGSPLERARALYQAPVVVLSHGLGADPCFNYGNLRAQRLFELSFSELLALPSRLSAEAADQVERQRLLDAVCSRGYIDDYAGVRISKSGRRFRIVQACVWNLIDESGQHLGQAAAFSRWTPL